MKRNESFLLAIIKSTCLTVVVALFIAIIARQQPYEAVAVFNHTNDTINITEENMVTAIKQYTDTDNLHKIKFTNGEIILQLHFNDMLQLVEKLDGLLNQYKAFYFQRVNNVNQLTIYISEQLTENLIYKVTIDRADYEAGKVIQFVPLP